MGFSRQEYWSGLLFPSPGDLPNTEIKSMSPASPTLQVDSSPTKPSRKCITSECVCVLDAQLCPTLCDPMDCIPPGSSVDRIFQTRILEWVAISSSRGSSWPRDQTHVSCTGRQILYHWATWETPNFWIAHPNSQDHPSAHWLTQWIMVITLGVLVWGQEIRTPKGLQAEVGLQPGLRPFHAAHCIYCSLHTREEQWGKTGQTYTKWVLKRSSALREWSLCLHALEMKTEDFQETRTTPRQWLLSPRDPNSKKLGPKIFSALEGSSEQ